MTDPTGNGDTEEVQANVPWDHSNLRTNPVTYAIGLMYPECSLVGM